MQEGAKSWRPRTRHQIIIGVTIAILAAAVVLALTQLNLSQVWRSLTHAKPGWVIAALVLMATSLFTRGLSWIQVLEAALPRTPIPRASVIRATMIGVMGSAVFPARVGEAARIVLITRRLEGRDRTLLPVVAGTVFSQTLINIGALAILAAAALSGIPALHGKLGGLSGVLIVPALLVVLVLAGPSVLRLARRSRSERVAAAAATVANVLALGRSGLTVFASPRHGPAAVAAQLVAWTLQWLACWALLEALSLHTTSNAVTAAGVLLAVNASAVLPATPANVGVFQAACIAVLAAAGVGAGIGLAYGILLQAVELVTAFMLGVPALLREGLGWRDLRSGLRSQATEPL
ncbi:MAG TPA: lysylphosphatidylglycerol synthase transmembrane domain-containing protein [Solirubrobacteraceae bacterium]|nr:lysylphosphatidylglycerol synthase transmembrane domain-containing protein [Solirubrobacteraceae bacterium]